MRWRSALPALLLPFLTRALSTAGRTCAATRSLPSGRRSARLGVCCFEALPCVGVAPQAWTTSHAHLLHPHTPGSSRRRGTPSSLPCGRRCAACRHRSRGLRPRWPRSTAWHTSWTTRSAAAAGQQEVLARRGVCTGASWGPTATLAASQRRHGRPPRRGMGRAAQAAACTPRRAATTVVLAAAPRPVLLRAEKRKRLAPPHVIELRYKHRG